MATSIGTYLRSVLNGLIGATAIGLVVATGCEILVANAIGKPFAEILDGYTFAEVGLIALPFAMLAILRITKIKCWVAGLVITCGYWGLVYLPSAMQIGGGVNIGWAITVGVMPFVTFMVSLIMLLPEAAEFDTPNGR